MKVEFESNEALVSFLVRAGRLQSEAIIDAFYAVDRKYFVPKLLQGVAYEDHPLSIGHQQTISQPSTVAMMLEMLQPQKGGRVLDIGAGSCYSSALLAKAGGSGCHITALERIPELVEWGKANLKRAGIKDVALKEAGEQLGIPGEQFDRILVSAAAKRFPKELVAQLSIGGRLVIPVNQAILTVEKVAEDDIRTSHMEGFIFVPLVYKE